MAADFDVVTGAFGQTGHAIATRLLESGRPVKTITRAPQDLNRPGSIEVIPARFDDPAALTQSLDGCRVLYSAIWARFPCRGSYDHIVDAIRTLFTCAKRAGVERIVKVTVATGGARTEDLPYWVGKARVEQALREVDVPYSILRPALIFSRMDTVINNVAWAMRHLRVVPVLWGGPHRICPVAASDLGDLAMRHGKLSGNHVTDAVGPETLTFPELLKTMRDAMGVKCFLPRLPPAAVLASSRLMAPILRDTLISASELKGLVRGTYELAGPVNCPTHFTEWIQSHADQIGRQYHSQRKRSLAKQWPNRIDSDSA